MSQRVVCCLGRYGDIINALPIAFEIFRTTGEKPRFVVSKQFWTILEGCSYVQPVVWDIDYKELPRAIARLPKDAIICQSYMHPDNRRLTESYQKEAWRLAGWLDKFGTIPLVFDQRNKDDEIKFSGKGPVLVALESVSSPISTAKSDAIWLKLWERDDVTFRGPMKCRRPFELLGQIETASCLIVADTMHLHLARATNTPIVAIINEGWFGSVPQGNVKAVIRYSEATPERIANAVEQAIKCESST